MAKDNHIAEGPLELISNNNYSTCHVLICRHGVFDADFSVDVKVQTVQR